MGNVIIMPQKKAAIYKDLRDEIPDKTEKDKCMRMILEYLMRKEEEKYVKE